MQYCGRHDKKADLLVIAPATSNTISKIANGIDDTTVTTFAATALGSKIPLIIVPAMHESMYTNPIIKKNIETLEKQGITFIEPDIKENKARLKPTSYIAKAIISTFKKKDLKNKKILITAGPTIEYIDPVRIITNPGSGKTGICLAQAAQERGAQVTLIIANKDIEEENYKTIQVKTTKDMYGAVKSSLKDTDILIHTASVSDFTFDQSKQKQPTDKNLTLSLKPTIKILDRIRALKKDIFLVGFKAEYSVSKETLIKRAEDKLKKAHADIIVANDVSLAGCGFATDENRITIITKQGKVTETKKAHKKELADLLLDKITEKMPTNKNQTQ